jgi:hypothetical protein
MNTAIARFAGEGIDYLQQLKRIFSKMPKKSGAVIIKIEGLDFKVLWRNQKVLRADYKTALGRVNGITISDQDGDTVSVGTYINRNDTSRDIDNSKDLVDALREDIAKINKLTATSANVIAKRYALRFGDVVIPIKVVTGVNLRGDWRFSYNGSFKLDVYGEANNVNSAILQARRADTTKRVSATLKGRLLVSNLQQKLDEAIIANKLVLVPTEDARVKGTVKIGDETIEVSVASLKLFARHIDNLKKLYGKSTRGSK